MPRRTVLFVDQQPTKVIIDVWQDSYKASPDTCNAVQLTDASVVTLASPLGKRKLLSHVVPLGDDGMAGR